ncbi:hypothetical protein ACQEU3_38355 [Spirillospora sp. CA-253888]
MTEMPEFPHVIVSLPGLIPLEALVDVPDRVAEQVANGLAYVCSHLDQVRAALGEAVPAVGAGEGVDALMRMSALLGDQQKPDHRDRDGMTAFRQEVAELLDTVHTALQVRGDALGIYGHETRGGIDAVGVERFDIVYRCPLQMCLGRDETEVSQVSPRCSISGQALIRQRLDP